jgi:hypothetical protein
LVALFLPGGDFTDESLFLRDAPIEALPLQDAQFDLGHIEPGAVFGRVMKFQLFDG